jgi:hypothetical protein
MTGLTNYSADNLGAYITGQTAMPALPSVFMALFTAVGTDAGTGFTEVSGGAYARVQIGGTVTTNGTTANGNPTLHFAATPAWVVAGMTITDNTTPSAIPAGTTVLSTTGTTVTMSANAAGAGVGGTDSISFSAFGNPPTGTAPATDSNTAVITFAQATLSWGTVIAWGLYDASSSGNLLLWDFMGNFSWLPFEIPNASGTVTAKAHGFASNDPVVFTAEYGGTLPSLSTGTMTSYTISFAGSIATDTFVPNTTSGPSTPFVSTSSGSGMVRKITQQPIAQNVTASFAAATFTITLA